MHKFLYIPERSRSRAQRHDKRTFASFDRPADLHPLFQVSEILARGEVSGYVAGITRLGRLTGNQAVECGESSLETF